MNRTAELTAIVAGLIAVVLAKRTSDLLIRCGFRSTSLSDVLNRIRLLTGEARPQEFLKLYVDLLKQSAAFAVFQVSVAVATLVPMATLYIAASGIGSVIAPTAVLSRNPFYPWLNDLQFIFCVSASCTAIAAALWSRWRKLR